MSPSWASGEVLTSLAGLSRVLRRPSSPPGSQNPGVGPAEVNHPQEAGEMRAIHTGLSFLGEQGRYEKTPPTCLFSA